MYLADRLRPSLLFYLNDTLWKRIWVDIIEWIKAKFPLSQVEKDRACQFTFPFPLSTFDLYLVAFVKNLPLPAPLPPRTQGGSGVSFLAFSP